MKTITPQWARLACALTLMFASTTAVAQIKQTAHFSSIAGKTEVTPKLLFNMYLNSNSHQEITGFPVKITGPNGASKERAAVGDAIDAFCFTEEQCGLKATVLSLQEGADANDMHVITLRWWAFAWMAAIDKSDLQGPMGAAESIVVLTFKKTKDGAQIELNQSNVPYYKVEVRSPDGSIEVGPLSEIVNTHWNTMYWDNVRSYLAK